MKLEQSITQTQPGVLVPLAALCCLVITVVGMGLKLPWFRRQMRLGNVAQRTATANSQRELTARITNMPSQGVFRSLNVEDFPSAIPPPPPRPVSAPATLPVKEKQPRPLSQPPPSTKPKANSVIVPPPAKPKSRAAPPSRRNPNAIAFSTASSAVKPEVQLSQAKGSSSLMEASNPMLQAMHGNTNQEFNDDEYLTSPNGYGVLPTSRSPKPGSKKGPKKDVKARSTKKEKKSPMFAKMIPKEVSTPPPVPKLPTTVPARYSSGSDNDDNDGNFTFTLPDSPQPVGGQRSFLHMNVGDSDECDA